MLLILLVFLSVASAQLSCKVTLVMGCWTDFTDGKTRALPHGPYTMPDNTHESCAAICHRFGTRLNAVEYGTQCFCGNFLNPAAHSQKVVFSDCNMNCPGNSSQSCGGVDRMTIYQADCTGNLIPNYQGCTDPVSQALPYCDTSLSHDQRLTDLMGRLTLDEKISMISPQPDLGNTCGVHTAGKKSIGLPPYYWLVEANTGIASSCLGPEQCTTTFSGPLGMAASWNRTNWYLKGRVLGTEMRAFSNAEWPRGTAPEDYIALTGYGPNINIARDPRFGRTSELPGEDPFLNGHYAKHMVKGMQTEDSFGHPLMLAYLKHFTAYSRETDRGFDTYNISLHDLFETYLAQYEIAFVEGRATGAMCSYNAENGIPSCANDFLLNKVIRQQWNRPDAHITTDCGAVANMRHAPANAPTDEHAVAWTINNGTDIEMGSTLWTNSLASAIRKGMVSEATVNTAFRRSYMPHFRAGRFDPLDANDWTQIGTDVVNSTEHRDIQMDAALQSFVLLKNDKNVLPIRKGTNVAVLGPMGMTRFGMLSDYAGDEICFGNVYDCIPMISEAMQSANHGGRTTFSAGVDINSNNASGIPAALKLAREASAIVLVLGIDRSIEHEGVDRVDTALPGLQEMFAKEVLKLGIPTTIVLCNGGALAIDNLVNYPNTAIVEAYNPSVAGPVALAKTLFGDSNRWGKLVTTLYPHSFISQNEMTNYDMALAPGRTYRYYTGKPLYHFGHGLSYTTFSLFCQTPSRNEFVCTVNNTGKREGDEVVQVYHSASSEIRKKAGHPIPIRSLVEFERVHVPAGSSVDIHFRIYESSFEVVNAVGKKVLYPGVHYLIFSRGHGSEVSLSLKL